MEIKVLLMLLSEDLHLLEWEQILIEHGKKPKNKKKIRGNRYFYQLPLFL
jgi:hypothetical protein